MLERAFHRVYGPAVQALALSVMNRSGQLPVPRDPPIAHASGADPDRILIIGGLAVRGLGVASHDLGLAGRLARALATRTGRGADVEAVGFGNIDTRRAAERIMSIDLGRFDAIIVQVGGSELRSLRPIRAWAGDITDMLAAIAESAPSGTPVLMLGSPPMPWGSAATRRIYARHLQRMNAVTLAACTRSRVAAFVALTPEAVDRSPSDSGPLDYARWAEDIAPALEEALAGSTPHHDQVVDEDERQRALDEMQLTRDPDIRLERVVRMARVVFGTTAAAVAIVERDREWMMSIVGDMDIDELPRAQSICSRTVRTHGVHVVEDLALVREVAFLPWVGGPGGMRFYAGFPLEAPGGQRIGALCVLDASPREFSTAEVSLLRDLALRAQAILWDPAGSVVA